MQSGFKRGGKADLKFVANYKAMGAQLEEAIKMEKGKEEIAMASAHSEGNGVVRVVVVGEGAPGDAGVSVSSISAFETGCATGSGVGATATDLNDAGRFSDGSLHFTLI